jgi:hypothetical protein
MKTFLVTVLAVVLAVPAFAAARLTYQLSGGAVPVYWPQSSFPLNYQIDRRVVGVIPEKTIDAAFAEWAGVPTANLAFRSRGVADGVKFEQDSNNTITVVDGMFKNQHFLALTTNWYDTTTGRLTEGDIQIDSVACASYNTQLLMEHEIGHLLGLDHSAVISSVMYPFVPKGGGYALDSDDRIAISGVYPRFVPNVDGATMKGQVTGDNGAIFAAQVVAMNGRGELVATALTDSSGNFMLEGLPPGDYRVYAEPLDGPVLTDNLAGVWKSARVVSFPTHFAAAGPVHITSGNVYGNINVNSTGTPLQLNPKWVGAFPPGSSDIALSSTSVTVKPGQSVSIAVGGDGFVSGMTSFEVLNSGFTRTSEFQYAGNYLYATFSVAADAAAGSTVILVHNGNDTAALTGALKVQGATARRRASA